jgi:tetratricopeptide (TPR) repeat protein
VERAPRYATAWAWLSKTSSRSASPAAAEERGVRELMQRALTEATTAVTLQPDLIESQIALALAYRGLEMTSAQRQAAERAIALDPRNGEARVVFGDANSMSAGFGCPSDPRPAAAEVAYREALRNDPLHALGRMNLATHLWWMDRPDDALFAMEEGLALQPENVLFKLWMPFNLAFAQRPDEAFEQWQRNTTGAKSVRPVDAFIAGIIELKRGRIDFASHQFAKAGPEITARMPFGVLAAVAQLQAGRMADGARYLERSLKGPACAVWLDRVPVFAPFKDIPEVRTVVARLR